MFSKNIFYEVTMNNTYNFIIFYILCLFQGHVKAQDVRSTLAMTIFSAETATERVFFQSLVQACHADIYCTPKFCIPGYNHVLFK